MSGTAAGTPNWVVSDAGSRAPDGSRPLRLVAVGELSAEAQQREQEAIAWAGELASRGRAAFQRFAEMDLPSAEALDCDVTGLSPARSELAVLLAWQAKLTASVAGHEKELAALKARPGSSAAGAQEELSALDRVERDAFSAWLRGGSQGKRPSPRSEERSAAGAGNSGSRVGGLGRG